MPTYSYECDNCGHKFDLFQKITAEPVKICPECHNDTVRRLIGAGAGLIFKGSGFYITDYRSKDYKEKSKKEHESTSSKSKSSKTESNSVSTGKDKKSA